MTTYRYIRASGIRALVKENHKRCGADFLDELNILVYETVCRAIKQFNGHHTTLDRTVVKWEANEARKAYYKAMTTFKANLPEIKKDKRVKYVAGSASVNYAYASLFNAIEKITPKLSEFGLSVAWFYKQTEKELTVTCRITHELGYSEETSLTAQHDTTGSKNAIQALGSTNSYLERYTFFALIGTAAKDQDVVTKEIKI